jgi:hypothetical protein
LTGGDLNVVERLIQLQPDTGGFQFALDTSSGRNI